MRLIDADNVPCVWAVTREAINATPTINPIHAAGACYCRECKHLTEKHYEDIGEKPYIKYSCNIFKRQMQSTDFCSYGERNNTCS